MTLPAMLSARSESEQTPTSVENHPILTRLIGALDQTQTACSAIPQSKLYSSSWIITLTSPNFFRIFLTIIVVLLEV